MVQGLKKKCDFGCIYCFTNEDYETIGQNEIGEDELDDIELIQPFCDYDVFACENCDWESDILRYADYGKIVSFATKTYISEGKAKVLSDINQRLIIQGAFLHVGVSITTINCLEEVEPKTASYEKRVESIKNLKKYNISCSVIIRPLLPVLTDEEIKRIVDDTAEYCDNYIYGPLYLNERITDYLLGKGIEVHKMPHRANWMKGQPKKYILDSTRCDDLVIVLKEYCDSIKKRVFDSNDSAIEDIRRQKMMNDILKLKELINNCYGDIKTKSTAMIADDSGKKYYGVSIVPQAKEAAMTSISNAIHNAVSDGAKNFVELIVYVETNSEEEANKIIMDEETHCLLKEFHIENIKIVYLNEKIVSYNLE